MAETYHVLNWRELPLSTAAVLAIGLHPDSRTFRKLRGEKQTQDMLLKAAILDQLRILTWQNTRDAEKGRNRPESVLKLMTEERKEKQRVTAFRSPEDFERRRLAIIKGNRHDR